jgi:serine/threonine-protein kinase ULK/ATG1
MQLINHENIIKLHDVKQSSTKYYLITEYCSGGDLEVLRGQKLSEAEVQKRIHQISAGLKALINKNVMHRDLKLSNILLSSKKADAVVKLADFGLARELTLEEYAATCCGTPLYMAPEILVCKKYNLKADLWSVGVMIYLFLIGKFPFMASTPQKLQVAINHGIVKFPPGFEISECCFELLKNLLQIEPEMRMDWEDYFAHPFIKNEPEKYEEFLKFCSKHNSSQSLNASTSISKHRNYRERKE